MRKNAVALEALPEMTARWAAHLGLQVTAAFHPSGDEQLFPNRLVLDGADTQWLLPAKGQALDALQFLVHEAQGEREDSRLAYLDVQAFRLFRMQEVKAMAQMAGRTAKQVGSYTFTSLSPRERRWVHLVTAAEPGLASESEGTGTFKALKVFRT